MYRCTDFFPLFGEKNKNKFKSYKKEYWNTPEQNSHGGADTPHMVPLTPEPTPGRMV